jgi:hypothetical protein
VSVDVALATRDLATDSGEAMLVSGHPDAEHGSGRGVGGDYRGPFPDGGVAGVTVTSKTITEGGRNAIRDALDGKAGAQDAAALGTDTDRASVTDSALGAELPATRRDAAGEIDDTNANQLHARAPYDFTTGQQLRSEADTSGTVELETGAYDSSDPGRLLGRTTVEADSTVLLDVDHEVELTHTFTITGRGQGVAVVTNNGEAAMAEALRTPAVIVGLDEMAFGSGTGAFSKGATALTTEEFRRDADRRFDQERLTVRSYTPTDEPANQPVSIGELGVFDTTGRLVWATTARPFTKDGEPLRADVGFLVR